MRLIRDLDTLPAAVCMPSLIVSSSYSLHRSIPYGVREGYGRMSKVQYMYQIVYLNAKALRLGSGPIRIKKGLPCRLPDDNSRDKMRKGPQHPHDWLRVSSLIVRSMVVRACEQ